MAKALSVQDKVKSLDNGDVVVPMESFRSVLERYARRTGIDISVSMEKVKLVEGALSRLTAEELDAILIVAKKQPRIHLVQRRVGSRHYFMDVYYTDSPAEKKSGKNAALAGAIAGAGGNADVAGFFGRKAVGRKVQKMFDEEAMYMQVLVNDVINPALADPDVFNVPSGSGGSGGASGSGGSGGASGSGGAGGAGGSGSSGNGGRKGSDGSSRNGGNLMDLPGGTESLDTPVMPPSPRDEESKHRTATKTKPRTVAGGGDFGPQGRPVPLEKAYAVLYADGELVFQGDSSLDPGRSVLHAEPVGTDTYRWWAGYWDASSQKVDGEWQEKVRAVSSRCPILASDNLDYLFWFCSKLEDVSGLRSWDVSSVRSFKFAFCDCKKLADVSPLADWDVSKAESMWATFMNCYALRSIAPLKSWRTPSLRDLRGTFMKCSSLSCISSLSHWDVSHVTEMDSLFCNCSKLSQLSAVYGWDVRPDCSMEDAFTGCPGEPPQWYADGSGEDESRRAEEKARREAEAKRKAEQARREAEEAARRNRPIPVLHQLAFVTREEMARGARKTFEVEGTNDSVTVDVAPGSSEGTRIAVPGHGRIDKETGRRGDLELQLVITPTSHHHHHHTDDGHRASGTQAPAARVHISAPEQAALSVRHQVLLVTHEELQNGAHKRVEVDETHERLSVDIAPGSTSGTRIRVPGYGREDKATGGRGDLELQLVEV